MAMKGKAGRGPDANPVKLPKAILAATDFSHGGDQAILHAWRLAAFAKARLVLVHVFDGRAYFEVLHPSQRAAEAEIAQCCRDAEGRLAKTQERLQAAGLQVTTKVIEGSPADKHILATAQKEGVDLIVVGTHGRRGISHAFLGSIAEHVLRGAKVPVLVVR